MKLSLMRPAIAVALALGLAACGGGKASFDVAGQITGLQYPGLVLTNNGTADKAIESNATQFNFGGIDYGTAYAVAVKAGPADNPLQYQPQHQTCTVFNGADTAGRLEKISITVACTVNAYAIGGKVVNLKTDNTADAANPSKKGLILINGSNGGQVSPVKSTATPPVDAAFNFATPVPYDVTYGVTVLQQPDGQSCSVSPNGTGTMRDAPVTDIVVTCVDNPA